MLPSDRERSYLVDMLQYSREVIEVIAGETYETFTTNRVKCLATERLIEIIGEAANHVSVATQESMPEIAWSKIIGMRNKLAHDYGEILSDRVWVIANTGVRELVELLERYGVKI